MADTWDLLPRVRPRARPDDASRDTAALGTTRPRTRPGGLSESTPEVQANATVAAAIPREGAALLGVFLAPSGNSALVRLPGEGIVKVAEGDTVGGGRVTAIDADALHLERNGAQVRLTMPG